MEINDNNASLLGIDVGTSFVKATLLDSKTGKVIAQATSPSGNEEREIIVNGSGFKEQNPEVWFEDVYSVTNQIRNEIGKGFDNVKIGISYQMHGLVCVDNKQNILRPSIIWSDGRAVEIGNDAFKNIGEEKCLSHLLNSPGNFTASKLKWVKENEPEIYNRIDKIMLPGNYIAMKLTGNINTTSSGLSEGIMWDFKNDKLASFLLDHYGISEKLIPEVISVFSNVPEVNSIGSSIMPGISSGTKVSYMAGDQPNNALSLGVLDPGEIAATAGTSGVIYGVTDKQQYDPKSRVNTFLHVNHSIDNPRYGVLSCVNGAGKLYSKVQKDILNNMPYGEMDNIANSSLSVQTD